MQATETLRSDGEVWAAVDDEARRQEVQLELIASENHCSAEVIAAMGTVLTNKYAEGYPGRRYYGGCEHVDVVENLARARAKELFGAEARQRFRQKTSSAANVQHPQARKRARWVSALWSILLL